MSAIGDDWRRFRTVLPGFTATTGLTLDSGLDSLFTFPWRCYSTPWTWICWSGARTTLGDARTGLRGSGLVTKLNQVNKTVFVFFPCYNWFSPGWMTASCIPACCIKHLHSAFRFTAPCFAQHAINYKLITQYSVVCCLCFT